MGKHWCDICEDCYWQNHRDDSKCKKCYEVTICEHCYDTSYDFVCRKCIKNFKKNGNLKKYYKYQYLTLKYSLIESKLS